MANGAARVKDRRAITSPINGRRSGTGRPKGSRTSLVARLSGLNHRVPDGTPPVLAEIAAVALARLVACSKGEVGSKAMPGTIAACREVRAEICGPLSVRVDMSVKNQHSHLIAMVEESLPALAHGDPASRKILETSLVELKGAEPSTDPQVIKNLSRASLRRSDFEPQVAMEETLARMAATEHRRRNLTFPGELPDFSDPERRANYSADQGD